MMNTNLKPIGRVKNIVEEIGLDISYAYDDLVFVEHNPFLLRFDLKKASKVYLHFNVDCETDKAKKIESTLNAAAKKEGLLLINDSKFSLSSKEETEEIEIKFEN